MKNRRSKWKLPNIDGDNIRCKLINPNMIGEQIYAYDGKKFKIVKIKLEHIGYRIGDIVHSKVLYKREYAKKNRN